MMESAKLFLVQQKSSVIVQKDLVETDARYYSTYSFISVFHIKWIKNNWWKNTKNYRR